MSPHYCKVGRIIQSFDTEFESNANINFISEDIEKIIDENLNEELL